MKSRFAIIITLALVLGLLIALNAASYVKIERTPDSEWNPDRSTYNSGATGTRALFDFLNEAGHNAVRWRESPRELLNDKNGSPTTFVIVGATHVPFEKAEAEVLLRWVGERGGRLVIIDRRPDARLLPASGDWRISTELKNFPTPDAHSDNPEEMTAGVSLARATQPTLLTRNVDSVMPSRFTGLINLSTTNNAPPDKDADDESTDIDEEENSNTDEPPPGPRIKPTPSPVAPPAPVAAPAKKLQLLSHATRNLITAALMQTVTVKDEPPPKALPSAPMTAPTSPAPVVHLANFQGALLVDYLHGKGRIIILSDPFIVANDGLNRADNLQLAVNVLANAGGMIAFDEYHQGRGDFKNELFAYFAGTPVLSMLAQLSLLVLVILWTSGRRFARPLPLARVDRRSSLEYVASMAELQQRARAYDLALENIYTRTRRVLVRYAGVDNNSSRADIAIRVAARSSVKRDELETLMRACEDAINGEPIDARRSLQLVSRLREMERALGLGMRSREIKQAQERV
jgi:hypothetical protein